MINEEKRIVPIPYFSTLQVLPPASSVSLAPTTQSKFRHYAQSNWTSMFFMTCTITNSKSTWCKHCTQRTTYLNLVIVQFLYKMFFRKWVLRRKQTKGTLDVSWYSLNNLSLIQTICILFRWLVLKLASWWFSNRDNAVAQLRRNTQDVYHSLVQTTGKIFS